MFDAQKTADYLVNWLKMHIDAAGAKGGLFGLSGGIDSTLVAALMKKAYPDNCLGVIMPADSMPEDKEDALRVAEILGLKTVTVDLSDPLHSFLAEVHKTGCEPHPMALANAKARLRMNALYYLATCHNYLVIGTGNRSERYVGYFTKHGDGGVDLAPIAGLVKSEVRAVAKALGVPDDLVNRIPSAGLYPGQTDEKEMGFTYEELDRYILKGQIENPEVVAKIERMHRTSEHKRQPVPIPTNC